MKRPNEGPGERGFEKGIIMYSIMHCRFLEEKKEPFGLGKHEFPRWPKYYLLRFYVFIYTVQFLSQELLITRRCFECSFGAKNMLYRTVYNMIYFKVFVLLKFALLGVSSLGIYIKSLERKRFRNSKFGAMSTLNFLT